MVALEGPFGEEGEFIHHTSGGQEGGRDEKGGVVDKFRSPREGKFIYRPKGEGGGEGGGGGEVDKFPFLRTLEIGRRGSLRRRGGRQAPRGGRRLPVRRRPLARIPRPAKEGKFIYLTAPSSLPPLLPPWGGGYISPPQGNEIYLPHPPPRPSLPPDPRGAVDEFPFLRHCGMADKQGST